jgi:hypothetical protein
MLDTTPHYVSVRGLPETFFERATEMRFAQADNSRELSVSQPLFQVLLDVLPDQSRLPGHQTDPRAAIGSCRVRGLWHQESVQFRVISKQLRRSFYALVEITAFVTQHVVDCTEELAEDPPESLDHRCFHHTVIKGSDVAAIACVETTTLAQQTIQAAGIVYATCCIPRVCRLRVHINVESLF